MLVLLKRLIRAIIDIGIGEFLRRVGLKSFIGLVVAGLAIVVVIFLILAVIIVLLLF